MLTVAQARPTERAWILLGPDLLSCDGRVCCRSDLVRYLQSHASLFHPSLRGCVLGAICLSCPSVLVCAPDCDGYVSVLSSPSSDSCHDWLP